MPCYQGAIHDRGDGLCYTAVEGSVLADCKDDSMIDRAVHKMPGAELAVFCLMKEAPGTSVMLRHSAVQGWYMALPELCISAASTS